MNWRKGIATFRGHREPHFDFIGRTRLWFGISGALIVLSLLGLFVRGLNYSIDFEGGGLLRYPNPSGASVGEVKSVLANYGRADAEVQVVGTGQGSEITIRTRSLTDLGGAPQTKFTFPAGTASETDLREALGEFGIFNPRIKISNDEASVTIQQDAIGTSDDVVIVYRPDPSKQVTEADVDRKLTELGRSAAQVAVIDGTVLIKTRPLDQPQPTPSPTPSGTASPSPGASASPGASPGASEGAGGTAATPSANASASAQPSPTGSAEPSPTASGSVAPTPTPSATPTGPPTPKEILEALGKQAGVDGEDITVRILNEDTQAGVTAAIAQRAGVEPGQVSAKDIGGDERARLLADLANQAGVQTDDIVIKDVGPTWGAQISKKALQGLIIFLVLVTLYISFRFEWKMAVSALTALAHDLIITAGIYALVGREVTPETVIAILTILGYSLYDTVVIFDRIKENTESLALVARDGYSGVVNLSLNETLMRSVNTSLVVLLPILSLLLFGGDTLKDFAFALFIGVTSGAYSSIFVASPMLAILKEREPRYAQMRVRAARAASRGQPQAAVVGGTATSKSKSRTGSTTPTGTPATTSKQTPKATSKPASAAAPSTNGAGDGAAEGVADGDGNGSQPAAAAGTAQAKPSGSAKPSGARPGGSRSKSKKRPPPAKRRRR